MAAAAAGVTANAKKANPVYTQFALETISDLNLELKRGLGESVRFFIKGGAAVPLLLGEPLEEITGDVDTMLLIDPTTTEDDFEKKRTSAIMTCIQTLLKKFRIHMLKYEVTDGDTTMAEISTKYKEFELKPENGKPNYTIYKSAPYQLVITGSFAVNRGSPGLTLLQLKRIEFLSAIEILDIIIPQKRYPLLSYYWNTIVPVELPYKGKDIVLGTVPVIDIVSAYVNQAYATRRSTAENNIGKRKGRANILFNNIKKKSHATRKANRSEKTKTLPENERMLFKSIINTLPNNTEVASPPTINAASLGALINMVKKTTGAGAVAGINATKTNAPASAMYTYPTIPSSMGSGAGAGAGASYFQPPLPTSPPPPDPYKALKNSLMSGKAIVTYNIHKRPLYTDRLERGYILRTYTNGLVQDVIDFNTYKVLTHIEYKPQKSNRGKEFIQVFANGTLHTWFYPDTDYFDPITMTVYRRY
jgi:hypothetical protein